VVNEFYNKYALPGSSLSSSHMKCAVIDHFNTFCIKFFSSKTVCMHFCRLRNAHPNQEPTLNGTLIPVVEQTNFLGFIFDNKVTFLPHIRYLKEKYVKALKLLPVVAHTSWGADQKTLLRCYRSFVRSKLDHGSVVYGSGRESYLRILDPIQNHALRLCLGAFRTSPACSLCVQANEPPLYIRRRMLSIQYSRRLGSSQSNPAYNTVFSPKFKASFFSNLIKLQLWVFALHQNFKRLVLSGILYLSYLSRPLLRGF